MGDRVVFTHPTGIDGDDDEEALVGRRGTIERIEKRLDDQPILVVFEIIDNHPRRGRWWCDPNAIQKVRGDER